MLRSVLQLWMTVIFCNGQLSLFNRCIRLDVRICYAVQTSNYHPYRFALNLSFATWLKFSRNIDGSTVEASDL